MVFTLLGSIPSKKNSRTIFINKKTGKIGNIPSPRYQKWHREQSEALEGLFKGLPISVPIKITVDFYLIDKRRRDLSNMVESINDLLVDTMIIADDYWAIVAEQHTTFKGIDRENPRAIIHLEVL